jgi:hypothetical protein
MDRKAILGEIKKLLKFGEMAFKDAKLIDGETIIRVDAEDWAEELPLFVVTPEGLVPAPAGEHTTLDGIKITVDEMGIIKKVEQVPVEEPTTETVVEEQLGEEKVVVEEEVMVEEEPIKEEEPKVEEMKKKIEAMEARIDEVEKMMTEMLPMMKETAEFSTNVLGKLDTFVKDTPAELEFKSVKSEYKKLVQENKTNKFSGLEGIKNIRKK